MSQPHTPIVLSVAGSDSGGGAGIQADIKAISATGSYACTVITALTAQNTRGVSGVMPVTGAFIEQQFESVFSDIAVDAVKIGMLGDADTIRTVAAAIRKYQPKYVVLDPVMVATSGDVLLAKDATDTLIRELIPLADVITPNLPEAQALLAARPELNTASAEDTAAHCEQLLGYGCKSVLIKGGHQAADTSTDFWLGAQGLRTYSSPRIDTQNTHGTGCTLSASIASFLAQGYAMADAIQQAKDYIQAAIEHADELRIGEGSGPVHHFYRQAR